MLHIHALGASKCMHTCIFVTKYMIHCGIIHMHMYNTHTVKQYNSTNKEIERRYTCIESLETHTQTNKMKTQKESGCSV